MELRYAAGVHRRFFFAEILNFFAPFVALTNTLKE
jgi:hypothetical protein